MPKWIMYHEYYGEGDGKALPFILSDREKLIIETMQEHFLLDTQKISFVEIVHDAEVQE